MIPERAARKGREPAVIVVTVEPLRRSAVANPVFYDRGDAVCAKSAPSTLDALDIRAHQAAHSRGILTKGAVDSRPARGGCKIRLLFDGETPDQVVRTRRRRQPPVFERRQLAVMVQVAELLAIHQE